MPLRGSLAFEEAGAECLIILGKGTVIAVSERVGDDSSISLAGSLIKS